MFKRQIIGTVAMILCSLSLYFMFFQYESSPSYTSLPSWAYNLMNWWSWCWLVMAILGICYMIFKVNSPFFARVAIAMWVVMMAVVVVDVLVTNGPSSNMTLGEFLVIGFAFFGTTAVNVLDIELLSQINEAARPKSDIEKAIENAM